MTDSTDLARAAYCHYLEGTSRTRQESSAEFDRWIAKVKAAALREAADTVDANPLTVSITTAWRAAEFLRAEADRIEKEVADA